MMDNNTNSKEMNPYMQATPMPENTPDGRGDKDGHKNPGFGAGIAAGVCGAIVLGIIVLFSYSMISGRSVQTVATGSDLLDSGTVNKIDELSDYIDEYYYEDYDKDSLKDYNRA